MNVFYEFHKIAKQLQAREVEYAVIGGVAVAIHARPRFTKDIDILVKESGLEAMTDILEGEGYRKAAPSWTFKDTKLTLHRFIKTESEDEMLIDVLVAGSAEHEAMVDQADTAESESLGRMRVARCEDLIRLKRARNSKMDQADIEALEEAI